MWERGRKQKVIVSSGLLLSPTKTDPLRVNVSTLFLVLRKMRLLMILVKGLMMMMICQIDDQVLMLTQPNYFRVKEGRGEREGSIMFLNNFAKVEKMII